MARRLVSSETGVTLVEALIACAVLLVLLAGVARLVLLAVRTGDAVRHETTTVILAAQKMEQLRSLNWTWEPGDAAWPLTDVTSDASQEPMSATGRGLLPSPLDSLTTNVTGYVDYLDRRGRSLGTGTAPPPGAVYVRRWSITPWPPAPDDVVALQVLVRIVRHASLEIPAWRSVGGDAWLFTLRSRKRAGGLR